MSEGLGSRRRPPIWAVLTTIVGALLMVVSGGALVAAEVLQARYALEQGDLFDPDEAEAERYGEDIKGPVNILLAGLDTRPSRPDETPRADAVVIVHVPAGMNRAYFVSLPRDALVDIPPFEPTGYQGGRDRLNAAMAEGAAPVPGEERPDVTRGFQLLARTVSGLVGIDFFDAGAVLRFEGFVGIVDALGGITVNLDEEIISRHRQPDGTHREVGCGSYCGPQARYPAGRNELEGWQALDVVRQRYGVTDGDYGRQRNQQKILKAIMDKASSRDVVTDPVALDRVLRAAGDAMVFDGRGREPIDFAFALRHIRSGSVTTITLPGSGVIGAGNDYQGEELQPAAYDILAALREDRLDEYVAGHPEVVEAG
jgi:LCP family protein required for cell wall assembly